MSLRLTALALLAAPLLGALSACQAPPPRISGGAGGSGAVDAAAAAQCRQQAEDMFNAQNRSARIQIDSRDTPFSGAYNSSGPTRGLSDRYAMDSMIGDCIRNAANRQAGPDLGTAQGQPAAAGQPVRAATRLPSGPAGGPPASSAATAPAGVPLERAPPPPTPARP